MADRCRMCRDLGWTLDGKFQQPETLELLPCPLPDCLVSGQEIALLSVDRAQFTHAATGPDGVVMSVSR